MSSTPKLSRRALLQAAGAVGAGAVFWKRRPAWAANNGPVKRVLIVHCYGGVRWSSVFDGQPDIQSNPWGPMNWSVVGRGSAPQWGFSRIMLQKPLPMTSNIGWPAMYSYIQSDTAANYNVAQVPLSTWKNTPLPTLADIAKEIAVVRLTGNPGGQFNSDHASASHTLYTAYASGQVGVATAFQAALKAEMGSGFDTAYPMPAVCIGQQAWTLGVGPYASSRPVFLASPLGLPKVNPGASIPVYAHKAESDLDVEYQQWRQAFMGQQLADFMNDKAAADAHVSQLVNPALHFDAPQPTPSPSLGTLTDGTTALTNAMLEELFGVTSAAAPPGDLLFDIFGALNSVPAASATWTTGQNSFGANGALAVRLLQMGSPLVSITPAFSYDSHSYEVVDPSGHKPQTVGATQLARLMAALNFALKNTQDPSAATGKSLWDSTVVIACSEFGRGGSSIGSNGFNSPNGQNDGGSDHGMWCGWPVMGGPVAGGGKLLTDTANGGFFHQNRVFTTLLKGLGISDPNNAYVPYGTFPPVSGLIQGV